MRIKAANGANKMHLRMFMIMIQSQRWRFCAGRDNGHGYVQAVKNDTTFCLKTQKEMLHMNDNGQSTLL